MFRHLSPQRPRQCIFSYVDARAGLTCWARLRRPVSGLAAVLSLVISLTLGGLGQVEQAVAEDAPAVTGEQVYAYCVECHGKRGEGSDGGTFPRIAGLPQPYVDRQLHAFKSQTRINKPMVPIFKHHRFDAEVIDIVAGHVAGLTPPKLSLWPYQPSAEALAAFADKAAFDAAGATTYAESCADCHGADASGDEAGKVPPLVAQYPAYLKKQMADFARGERKLPAQGRCGDVDPALAEALIAHVVELGK